MTDKCSDTKNAKGDLCQSKLKEFIFHHDYFMELLKRMEHHGIARLDFSTTYELIYSHIYLSNLPILNKDIEDLSKQFELIFRTLPSELNMSSYHTDLKIKELKYNGKSSGYQGYDQKQYEKQTETFRLRSVFKKALLKKYIVFIILAVLATVVVSFLGSILILLLQGVLLHNSAFYYNKDDILVSHHLFPLFLGTGLLFAGYADLTLYHVFTEIYTTKQERIKNLEHMGMINMETVPVLDGSKSIEPKIHYDSLIESRNEKLLKEILTCKNKELRKLARYIKQNLYKLKTDKSPYKK